MTKNNKILISLVIALFLGVLTGSIFGSSMFTGIDSHKALMSGNITETTNDTAYFFYKIIKFGGVVFLNLLNMMVIPLVVTSLIMGMVALGDIRHAGTTGLRTFIYYFATTSFAVLIGIVLVQIISPGVGIEESHEIAKKVMGKENQGILDTVLSVFVNESNPSKGMFPANVVGAMATKNVLGVIAFSILFGAAITTMGDKGKLLADFFSSANEVILKIIHWILKLLPLGIFGLIVARLAEIGGAPALMGELSKVALYFITVVTALAVHGLIVLPLILWYFTGRSPLKYAKGVTQALLTAFSTASSSATLPITMECAEDNNQISKKSASFVLPLGATINMDGTALYEAVAVIFIAQVYGIHMDATMLLVVFLTATLAAIGAAGIPEAGLVTMIIVLNATGVPLEGIGILLSIDWLLDRCRTTLNVWGDSIGAAVIDKLEEKN